MHKRLPQLAAFMLVLICFLAINAPRVGAFADTKFFDFPSPSTSTGPNSGSVWGSNYQNAYNPSQRAIQAEGWAITWDSSRMNTLKSSYSTVGPVIHLFREGTSNCEARFNADGYTEGSAGYMTFTKEAGCFLDPVSGYQNERRMYWNTSSMQSGITYFGGAEFLGANYPSSEVGKVVNDIYFNAAQQPHAGSEHKGTWCFTNSGSAYAC